MPRTDKKMFGRYVGIDNGVTGSVGIVTSSGNSEFFPVPVFKEQSYTKKKNNISRVNSTKLEHMLRAHLPITMCLVERPMVNPGRFQATMSALRALEAVLCVLERLGIPRAYVDSKEWQRPLLPKGTQSPVELKKASMDIGCRLFPAQSEMILKHKDADGLLIAEHCRRMYR